MCTETLANPAPQNTSSPSGAGLGGGGYIKLYLTLPSFTIHPVAVGKFVPAICCGNNAYVIMEVLDTGSYLQRVNIFVCMRA